MLTPVPKIAFVSFFFILAFAQEAVGQQSLQKPISVSVERKELKQVLISIQAQTGVRFTYSSDIVDVSRKISCNLVQKKLVEFFDIQLRPLGIEYKVIDEEQILLFVPAGRQQENHSLPNTDDLLFTVSAKVTDPNDEPLAGVSVWEKGTNNGATTDENGMYSLSVHKNAILVFSFIGYAVKEVKAGNVKMFSVVLNKEVRQIDEVVVTGVFDKRTKIESSIAITALNAADIEKQYAVSAADMLTHVPGVYVNSSFGEIRNVVYSRGISANSTDAASGYYYVSLQEDGLPVSNVTFNNFGPDYFYRADASFKRLEAVRGGTASILGANAPGGLFNYISKTGGEQFAGSVRARYGMEGDGNGYYRGDINLGGPIRKGWYYNGGGFYRYSLGARYPGYPLNEGGQLKGNITKQYRNGCIKFYAKYLSDHNGWFEFLPAKNFHDPKLAPGVRQTDSYLLPGGTTAYPFLAPDQSRIFDPKRLVQSKEIAFGQNIEQSLGKGWRINNNLKYSGKEHNWQSSSNIYQTAVDNSSMYTLLGAAGRAGVYSFRERTTGKTLAQTASANGSDFTVLNSQLPGESILPGGVTVINGFLSFSRVREWMDQFSVTRKTKRGSFTGGIFYANSAVDRTAGSSGTGVSSIQNRPQLLDIAFSDAAGKQYHLTNDRGYANLGARLRSYHARQHDLALFIGHAWQIDQKWILDGGIRYEYIAVNGSNHPGSANPNAADHAYGGVDGNPATIYDNGFAVPGAVYYFDKSVHSASYSFALNHKINKLFAVYGRYAHGQKAPDLAYYFSYDSHFTIENNHPGTQKIDQAEIGLKATADKLKLSVTPFYSLLSDVYSLDAFQTPGGDPYLPRPLYNSVVTVGMEAEADYTVSSSFHIKSVATFQRARTKSWGVWIANKPGIQDDTIANYTGKKADNNPGIIFSITPSYTAGRFDALLAWKYMGSRPGNIPNTITLPGFSQVDIGIGCSAGKRVTVRANINNLFNAEGVMGWTQPAKYFDSLDRQGFTKEKLDANPGATFGILCIQPRSYFLNLSCNF